MKNLDKLIDRSGFTNKYLIQETGIPPANYYRKKRTGDFSYHEIKKILEVLNRNRDKPVSFEDLES